MEKTFTSANDLRIAAKAAGIKDSRLDKAVETYNLPEEGEFTEVQLVEGEFPHIRLITNLGNKISLSGLQAMAHFGSVDTVILEKIKKEGSPLKGKVYVKGSLLNPHLSGDQSEIAFRLIGKSFKATSISGVVLPFKESGYSESEAKKALTTKTFYKVEIL